jgi:hypothetical protein
MIKEKRTKAYWRASVFITVYALTTSVYSASPFPRIDISAQPRQIVLTLDGKPLATYVYQDPKIPRPYFKDLCAPGGNQVTRNHPPREGVDRMDHPDYHPGLWLAFGDLGGADFWRNKARVEHVEFTAPPYASGDRAGFTVRNRYIDGDRTVCEEICAYTLLIRPAGTLILWDSTFQSEEGDFWFGDQEEMGLGVRLATPIMVKSRQGGRILNNHGQKDEKGTWGKIAAWCDYSGWIDGQFVGVTIMPDPANVRPCWWHSRDYGFFTANPFGRKAFKAGPPSKIPVARGKAFKLAYGILLHANPSEDTCDLPGAYQDFLSLLKNEGRR